MMSERILTLWNGEFHSPDKEGKCPGLAARFVPKEHRGALSEELKFWQQPFDVL